MPGVLDSIVALQKTLDELEAVDRRLNSIPDWMQELHEEHSTKKSEIEAAAEVASQAEMSRREAEGELADAQEKLKHYQEQISRVSTQREYGALLKEIDTVKSRIAEAEKNALDALETKENAEGEKNTLEEGFQELDGRYKAELEKWEGEKPAFQTQKKELEGRETELREGIPRNMQTFFDRLRQRMDGKAIAPVVRLNMQRSNNAMWHCASCNYNVRPQLAVELRRSGEINQCESCRRILYLPVEAESEA